MKTNKFWGILSAGVLMFGALVSFSSCGSDHDDEIQQIVEPEADPYDVVGTTWAEESSFSGGYSSGTYLTFSTSTAKLQIAYTEGTQTLTTTYNFTYRRSQRLVILQPKDDDIATLEGQIDESGIKMTLINTSNNSTITTLYKQ